MPGAYPVFPYAPPNLPPPQRHSLLGVIICWAVILGTTAVILVAPHLAPEPTVVEEESNIQLKFAGRYALGLKLLVPGPYSQSSAQLRDMIEDSATSPIDQ